MSATSQVYELQQENAALRARVAWLEEHAFDKAAELTDRLAEALRLGHEMVEKGHAQEARLAEAERLLHLLETDIKWHDGSPTLKLIRAFLAAGQKQGER